MAFLAYPTLYVKAMLEISKKKGGGGGPEIVPPIPPSAAL